MSEAIHDPNPVFTEMLEQRERAAVAVAERDAARQDRDSWRGEACRLANETIPKMAEQAMQSIGAVISAGEGDRLRVRIEELELELGEIAETWELMATEIDADPGALSEEKKKLLGEMCRRAATRCRSVQWGREEEPELDDIAAAIGAHLESGDSGGAS